MRKIFLLILAICILITSCDIADKEQTTSPGPAVPGYPVTEPTSNPAYPAPQGSGPSVLDLTGFITDTPDPERSPIIISGIEKHDGYETILITNIDDVAIDIGGYMLYAPELTEKYVVPSPMVLEPGQSYGVCNGDSSKAPEMPFWLASTIINKVEDQVWLINKGGAISYYFNYYPSSE